MKLRVCHMTSVHPSLDKRIFYKECKSLNRAGYETYIVAPGESFERDGVRICGVPKPRYGRLQRILVTTRHVYEKAMSLNADVYHVHDPELLPYALKLKRKGKIVIFDSHEDCFVVGEKSYIPKIIQPAISLLVSKYLSSVCPRLDAIISVTPHICDKYRKLNSRTYMVTNYAVISPEEKNMDQPPLSKNKNVVFAGGISTGGNHARIIEAVSKLDGVKYVLIGWGEGGYLDSLMRLNGWHKVEWVGRVPYEKVRPLLQQCAVGVVVIDPKQNTGGWLGTLGNTKLFEYLRAGLPVVCTRFELWEQIIDEWECGICVDPTSVDEIGAAIKALIYDYEMASRMGDNGRKAVWDRFNWGTQEKVLLDVYQTISGG